jgi:hypothetical protein
LASWILGYVDKPHEITVVEVTEAMHLVDRRNGLTNSRHDLRRQFKA